MTMRVLALDPATKCGWARMDGTVSSGVWNLNIRRDESGGMRLVRFKAKLREMFDAGIDLLVYEAARNAGPKMQGALVVQSELQGVLKEWCESVGITYRGYSPSEIKKHACGKGNANKAAMVQTAVQRYGMEGSDDNQADAICLLMLALDEYDSREAGR